MIRFHKPTFNDVHDDLWNYLSQMNPTSRPKDDEYNIQSYKAEWPRYHLVKPPLHLDCIKISNKTLDDIIYHKRFLLTRKDDKYHNIVQGLIDKRMVAPVIIQSVKNPRIYHAVTGELEIQILSVFGFKFEVIDITQEKK